MKGIINARVIMPDAVDNFTVVKERAVLYDERITHILPMSAWRREMCDEVTNAHGLYLSPGFINIHVHGSAGYDTMDDDPRALPEMASFQAKTGVTAFLPTTMTEPKDKIFAALSRIRAATHDTLNGAAILGANMEGPFLGADAAGVQSVADLCPAEFDGIAPFADVIKILTVAPEMISDPDFVRRAQSSGIVLSLGHTTADYDTAVKFIKEYGIKHITHTFNGMKPFHHRAPGAVGAALDSEARCEIIADFVHVHPMALRLLYRVKKPGQIIIVTDSLRACGMGDGKYEFGGREVTVTKGVASLPDGTLGGSVLPLNRMIKNFADATDAPLTEVIMAVTKTPAVELKLYDDRGSIEVGKLADFTIFDDNLNILATIAKGRTVYRNTPQERERPQTM